MPTTITDDINTIKITTDGISDSIPKQGTKVFVNLDTAVIETPTGNRILVDYNDVTLPVVASAEALRDEIVRLINKPTVFQYGDSPSLDAFGRLRTSDPFTIFDSKQLHDSQPLFWDDQETSGSGTSTSHSSDEAATTITVGATTAGTRVRQTFQRFNYQPGKSQQILCTFSEFDTSTGITKRVGYFDGSNGLFFESDEGNVKVVRRTSVTGTPVDNSVDQESWNLDPMDGTGDSGITLDFSKSQIAIIDFEWLGVGRVRMGWVVDGMVFYCHQFLNANVLDKVYMSTPNLPIRYEISNDGNGATDDFMHICSSVKSEGGQENNGILRHADSGAISGLSAGTTYAVLGIRLQSGKLDGIVDLENISIICNTVNDQAHWELIFNPTVAGTFTYANETNSIVQTANGSSSNTITGGTEIDGGYFTTSLPITNSVPNALNLGSAIDGTVDEIILAARPITNNITIQASLTWRELS